MEGLGLVFEVRSRSGWDSRMRRVGIDRIKRKDYLYSWTQSKAARVVAAMLMPTDSVLQATVLPKGKPCPYSDRKPAISLQSSFLPSLRWQQDS